MITFFNFSSGLISYGWQCAKCDTIHTEARKFNRGDAVWQPTMPDGWTELQGRFYCPDHKIEILVDGRPV